MQVNDTNRALVISTILASYAAMSSGEQTAMAHAIGTYRANVTVSVNAMSDERLSDLYYDIEDNGLLIEPASAR